MLGKSSPYPHIPVLLFFSSNFYQNYRISFLFHTTCLLHVFLEMQNLSLCLFIALCPHCSQSGGLFGGFHFVADRRAPAWALVRTRSWFLTVETQVQEAQLGDEGVGSKSALELNFPKYITNRQDYQGKRRQCGLSLKSWLMLLGASAMSARLLAVTALACRFFPVLCTWSHSLARGRKWC
uniref:Uncharacterized protein n=1 Tax=Molossus molossus TaxID=27622 RepID=A0A7J8I8N7_MOLMO|nr:hypothetical protein HJG59_010534 [Molossus molossus]